MKKLIDLWNIAMRIFKRKHKPTKTNKNLNYLYNQQINNKTNMASSHTYFENGQMKTYTIAKEFSMNETTKENFLKFKEEIKSSSHSHPTYIAYYIFKHRIGCDKETKLVDANIIEKYLDEVAVPACKKGLYKGTIYPYSGGDSLNWAIDRFKAQVRIEYNKYADPEQYKEWKNK